MEAEQFNLAFNARDKGKNSSQGDIHDVCVICIRMQIKQVDAEGPPKAPPGVIAV